MSNLTLIAAVLFLSPGCFSGSGGDDPGGQFRVTWTLQDGVGVVTCADVWVTSIQIATDQIGGDGGGLDAVLCANGTATTSSLPLGDYWISLRAVDENGALVTASTRQTSALGTEGAVVELPQFAMGMDPEARLNVAWVLTDGDGGPEVTCAVAGADTIRVVSRPAGATDYVDLFDCTDGSNETADLPLGDYIVWAEARDSGDAVLGTSDSLAVPLYVDDESYLVGLTVPVGGS